MLHGYGGASKSAYCAVVYLCVQTEAEYATRLVASKSRVAPLSPTTIPRLELLAALVLARLIIAVRETLSSVISIQETFCWTDSMTAFYWIRSSKEYKQFVQNRIDEIHKLTDVSDWQHCPGEDNPADIGSRGFLASELKTSRIWLKGPQWLCGPPENYPKVRETKEIVELSDECMREMRVRVPLQDGTTLTLVAVEKVQDNEATKVRNLSEIINCEHFSDSTRLFRVTALVFKFVALLRAEHNSVSSEDREDILSADQVRAGRTAWIQEAQKNVEKSDSFKGLKQQLGLYKDEDQLLKCRGRLAHADFPFIP